MLKELNSHKYLDLIKVGQTDHQALCIGIAEARTIDNSTPATPIEESNDTIRKILNECSPIEATEMGRSYELVFHDYITYSVTNESYTIASGNEEYEGKLARIYSKSAFLDYVANSTFAMADYPGPFRHYGFICLDRIVDVASMGAPTIKVIDT